MWFAKHTLLLLSKDALEGTEPLNGFQEKATLCRSAAKSICVCVLLKDNLLSSPSPLLCIRVKEHVAYWRRVCVSGTWSVCDHALIACQSKLASVWHLPGTHCCLPSTHHPHTYVPKNRINNQCCQSCFIHNNSAFRESREVTGIWPSGWPIWSS